MDFQEQRTRVESHSPTLTSNLQWSAHYCYCYYHGLKRLEQLPWKTKRAHANFFPHFVSKLSANFLAHKWTFVGNWRWNFLEYSKASSWIAWPRATNSSKWTDLNWVRLWPHGSEMLNWQACSPLLQVNFHSSCACSTNGHFDYLRCLCALF